MAIGPKSIWKKINNTLSEVKYIFGNERVINTN